MWCRLGSGFLLIDDYCLPYLLASIFSILTLSHCFVDLPTDIKGRGGGTEKLREGAIHFLAALVCYYIFALSSSVSRPFLHQYFSFLSLFPSFFFLAFLPYNFYLFLLPLIFFFRLVFSFSSRTLLWRSCFDCLISPLLDPPHFSMIK